MRRAGAAAAPKTPPRRKSDISSPDSPQPLIPLSKSIPATRVTPSTPIKHPAAGSPSSPVKRPPATSPSLTHSKPTTSPPRQSVHRSPHRSPPAAKPKPARTIHNQSSKPPTSISNGAVQVWNFDEKDDSEQTQQRLADGESKEQEVRTVPLSALFGWPSSSNSTVLSFQSLSTYTLPPLPSYDTIPSLCGQLIDCDTLTEDQSYGAVYGLNEFGASDLLASPHASLVVSSLISATLLLRAPLLPVSAASLLLLADLFDAAHSSHIAAELYLLLLQHVLDKWRTTTHWPGAQSDVWLEDEPRAATYDACSKDADEGSAGAHMRRSHAHLTRVMRFITIMQRQLPEQWVYFSPFTLHSIIDATLQLYATAVSPSSASLLSPAHMLAILDPTCTWLSVWLYQLPTRKRFMQRLASSACVPLLDWMTAPPPSALIASRSASTSTPTPTTSTEAVSLCIPAGSVPLLQALQRARFVECLMAHGSGRRVLRAAWMRAGLAARSEQEVRDTVQHIHAAAPHSLIQAQHKKQPESA